MRASISGLVVAALNWGSSGPGVETRAEPPPVGEEAETPGETPPSGIALPAAEDVAPGLVASGPSPEEPRLPRAEPPPEAPAPKPKWMRRWLPERHMVVFGVFGGVFLPHEQHDLYDPRTAPPEPLWALAADVGARLGYYPLSALGVEAEFSAVPTRMRTLTDDFVFVYGFRGHVVVQLPYGRLVPFLVGGAGLLGVRSHVLLLGNDVDPAVHYGGGLKLALHRWIEARVEARNILSAAARQENTAISHVQVLAGLSMTWRPRPKASPVAKPQPRDRDADGILDADDACPTEVGVRPHGCPDTDGDGFIDREDPCPRAAGDARHGCPDSDGDGFRDPDDGCPQEPETSNGYLDDDGCPDTLPERVRGFTGTIDGIAFDVNEATIRASSRPVLDEAIAVLRAYPDIRVRIVGHTDDSGSAAFNLDLSRRRAEAVAAYLVAGGIDAGRIETEGRGAREPRAPNDTPEERALNRRIDFEVIGGEPAP